MDDRATGVLHVACAADQHYLAHSAAMLHSVLTHGMEHRVHIHYLHGPGLTREAISRLTDMAEDNGGTISFVSVADGMIAELPEMSEVTATMWYRIFLPELLPDVDRALYLDIDTIVLDSLAPLWEIDLRGYYLAAVSNVWPPWIVGHPDRLGLPGSQIYFNSGVVLMNLDLMRRDHCTPAIRRYAIEHRSQLVWPDQDALNVVLGSRRLGLHPRWNCMNSILQFPGAVDVFTPAEIEEAHRRPAIRHFEGPSVNKPWHVLCETRDKESYRRHRRQTPWPRYLPDGITPRTILVRTARAFRPHPASGL